MSPPVSHLDLQLNGYKGVDFNADDLTLDAMHRACVAVRDDGGGRMLATVITDSLARMTEKIGRLAAFHAADAVVRETMAGIHVEGPFISPVTGFVGAHPVEHVVPATVEAACRVIDAGAGLVRLVTLAPEHDAGMKTVRWLSDQGILVSAGHCDPTIDQLERAIDSGLGAFTHLGNGCPILLHRHDNIIQRVLSLDRLRWVMVIADGVHLPPLVLRNIVHRIGVERMIAVTDATAAAGMGPGRYRLSGQDVVVGPDGAAWAPDRSHLIGSTATMAEVRHLLLRQVELTPDEVDRVTVSNPAAAMGWA